MDKCGSYEEIEEEDMKNSKIWAVDVVGKTVAADFS